MPLVKKSPALQRTDSASDQDTSDLERKTGKSSNTARLKKKHEDDKYDELRISIDEIKEMLSNSNTKQDTRHKSLLSDMKEIKDQNSELRKSFEYMSQKYDDMKLKLDSMETERKNNFLQIKKLEDKIELLEKSCKAASLEIRNVPQTTQETKDDLVNLTKNLGNVLKLPIEAFEIKDIFRTKSKQANQPIVVELTSVIKKEKILNSLKSLKKDQKGSQLTSAMISIGGPSVPIYVSENLTAKARRIFALAREFARENSYKFCWSSHGIIYIRKADGTPAIRIREEEDLEKLKK